MTDTYDVDHTDRLAINRVRSAAKRGDTRAQATLEAIEQQAHADRWRADEQRRADLAEQRANRKRYSSVASVMADRRKEREAKEERTRKALTDES